MAQTHVRIFCPNKHFNGARQGVAFRDGEALATPEQARHLVSSFGYECPELEEVDAEAADAEMAADEGRASLLAIEGIGDGRAEALIVAGIPNALTLAALTDDELAVVAPKVGVSAEQMKGWQAQADHE